jgi:hypothetical protein
MEVMLCFLLYEIISKKPSDKFLENAQMVGFVLLISLLFANGNDIYKAIVEVKKKKSVIFICTNQMIAYLCTALQL